MKIEYITPALGCGAAPDLLIDAKEFKKAASDEGEYANLNFALDAIAASLKSRDSMFSKQDYDKVLGAVKGNGLIHIAVMCDNMDRPVPHFYYVCYYTENNIPKRITV